MASIDKAPNGKPRVRWRDPDGTQRKRVCPDKKTATRLKADVGQCEALGVRWEEPDARRLPDIEDVVVAYIKDKRRTLGKATLERYARSLELFLRFVVATYGARERIRVSILTKNLLREFFDWLGRPETGLHGQQRSQDTQRKIVELVQLMWAWAANEDEFTEVVPLPKKLTMKRSPGRETQAPTWEQMDAAIAAAPGWYRHLLIVMRFTGLRVSQVMRLERSDLDLERCTLRIRGELGKSRQEQRGRTIPVSKHLVEIVQGWNLTGTRLIVPASERSSDMSRQARERMTRSIWRRASVPELVWNEQPNHAFRKGFISSLKRSGADDEAVEYLVGHSLGLRGVYTSPDALPLVTVANLIPPLRTLTVVPVSAPEQQAVAS